MNDTPWIPVDKIAPLIGVESLVLLSVLTVAGLLFYHFLLREISEKRHASMRKRFKSVGVLLLISSTLAAVYWYLRGFEMNSIVLRMLRDYCALLSLIAGAVLTVRIAQSYVYLFLFFANMKVGVPRLIANIFTLVFSVAVAGWICTDVFGIRLVPLLATSAIFSVVLGLALQDTLGNFFSGVALQIDRPFYIGDWIEVQNGAQTWVGQVTEMTWRATALTGFSDEMVSIPNKILAQSQVTQFATSGKAPRRNQAFRFPLDTPIDIAKQALHDGLQGIPLILSDPAPRVLVLETTEHWISMKIFYSVADFGAQYRIGDQVITQTLAAIRKAGLRLASPTLSLLRRELQS